MESTEDIVLRQWFCNSVLPLESALTAFIRRHWREADEVADIRQEIYERAIAGAKHALPLHTSGYIYAVARNHISNRLRRSKVVSFDLVADFDTDPRGTFEPEAGLVARDELRRALTGLEQLPPRCREVVRLRKVEGMSTREVANHMNVGTDTVEKQLTLGMRALADFMLGGTGKIRRTRGSRVNRGLELP